MSSWPALTKGIVVSVAAVALVLMLVATGGYVALSVLGSPPDPAGLEGTLFTVERGEPAISVAIRLESENLVKSATAFRILMKITRQEGLLKAGTYRIEPGMDASAVLDTLVKGKQQLVRLTIPEGAGLVDVAGAAAEAGIASVDDVIRAASDAVLLGSLGVPADSAMGYLFPDTYLLPADAGGEAVVSIMIDTFFDKLHAAIPESAGMVKGDLHNRIILASIIEREYRVPEEAPRMAGVFQNRLDIGMALQSCATVVFVLTEKLGKPHPVRLFDRDLKIDDPFNTYMYAGLPPEPICNPGITALSASFRPEKSDYLYFRLIDEIAGKHHFSRTLDEHIGAANLVVKPLGR